MQDVAWLMFVAPPSTPASSGWVRLRTVSRFRMSLAFRDEIFMTLGLLAFGPVLRAAAMGHGALATAAQLSFPRDAAGKVGAVVLHRNGRDSREPRR
jgi:hypothetical protein